MLGPRFKVSYSPIAHPDFCVITTLQDCHRYWGVYCQFRLVDLPSNEQLTLLRQDCLLGGFRLCLNLMALEASCLNIKKNVTNAQRSIGLAFLNLPPIVNALDVSRITSCVSLKILVSHIVTTSIFYSFLHSTQPLLLTFFWREQGRCNDLLTKCDGPVPQDDRSLLSTPVCSTNIKSDSVPCGPLSCVASRSRCHTADYLKDMKDVESSGPGVLPSLLKSSSISTNIKSYSDHCGPLSCVASGSRCHTADYLKETMDVNASEPCLMYSFSNPTPPGSMCSPSPVQTPLSAHSALLLHLPMHIVPLYFIAAFAVQEKSVVNRISAFEKWMSLPIR